MRTSYSIDKNVLNSPTCAEDRGYLSMIPIILNVHFRYCFFRPKDTLKLLTGGRSSSSLTKSMAEFLKGLT